ncbi:MAG TPA: hypothetical protein PLV70_07855 [Flavobacteriales bacterium]|nr:hypothetical protein [Flavobacteriales bacterium]HRN36431.1 hypothetical protein [Flavobacteriales bacterium]HRO38820.1 hypothetical protein [Flavobacteriales bacterium]HRP82468.1 hypothetical protein [Flavobacteriales bacterium]HRQ85006.1 hypothetical protein [Flavobacteriales bacterium]
MKWMISLALAATMGASAFAQGGTKGGGINIPEAAERLTTRMTQELGLSPQQAEQVQALNVKFLEQTMVQRDQGAEGHRGVDKVAILEARDQELKAVLTADQFQKMKEMQGTRARTTPDGQPIKEATPVK